MHTNLISLLLALRRFEALLQTGKSPTCELLFDWGTTNCTVGDLVDILVQNEFFAPASLLLPGKLSVSTISVTRMERQVTEIGMFLLLLFFLSFWFYTFFILKWGVRRKKNLHVQYGVCLQRRWQYSGCTMIGYSLKLVTFETITLASALGAHRTSEISESETK